MTRLGFALVTALDPGVLLMDEGIGAGDARFAERAEKRLKEFVGRSQIVVLASHSPELIRSICNKAALLQAGRLVALGPVDEIFEQYDLIVHGPKPSVAAQAPPAAAAPAVPQGEAGRASDDLNPGAAASETEESAMVSEKSQPG
jgi:ABC-type multidrug transport system ATPase subunit